MQEQLLERLRERLGEQAPQSFALSCGRRLDFSHIFPRFAGILSDSARLSEGPELVSLCQLVFRPRPGVAASVQAVGVFCEIRKGLIA